MVQVGCTPLFSWYRDLHSPQASALGCVNPIPTSTSWCNLYLTQHFKFLPKSSSGVNALKVWYYIAKNLGAQLPPSPLIKRWGVGGGGEKGCPCSYLTLINAYCSHQLLATYTKPAPSLCISTNNK